MSPSAARGPEAAAALVPRALLGSSAAVLVLGALLNTQGQTAGGPVAFSWVAAAWALVAPLVAVAVRGQGLVAPPPPSRVSPQDAAAQARRSIVFFALLESGAVLAGVAAMVSPPWWPLAAGLVPAAVMALNLPPRAG
jgi:hypothetical protein